ncbi:hypothetical protein JOD69_003441 [Methylocaldum sp. RMAD-M]|jgi:hypothetical protein|nr:hypothetical protein [Methylocaldum sp. RMAD-M]
MADLVPKNDSLEANRAAPRLSATEQPSPERLGRAAPNRDGNLQSSDVWLSRTPLMLSPNKTVNRLAISASHRRSEMRTGNADGSISIHPR